MQPDYGLIRSQVHRYTARRLSSPEDAEDVAQEVMLRLWANRGRVENPGAYAMTSARHALTDRYRRQARLYFQALPEDDGEAHAPLHPALVERSDYAERVFHRGAVAAVLRTLSAYGSGLQYETLRLVLVEQYTAAEAGVMLGRDVGAVKGLLRRARQTILRHTAQAAANEYRRI